MFWDLADPPEEGSAAEAADGAVVRQVAGVGQCLGVADRANRTIGNLRLEEDETHNIKITLPNLT
jgi:hypothetical protein